MWVILLCGLIIILIILGIFFYPKNETLPESYEKELNTIFNGHAQNHRSLLLETIGNFQNRDITYKNIIKIDKKFRPYLISKYGLTISNNIISLLERKDEIIAEYYLDLSQSYCKDSLCVKSVRNKDMGETKDFKILESVKNKIGDNFTVDNFFLQYGIKTIEGTKSNLDEINKQIITLMRFEKKSQDKLVKKFEILLELYDQEILNQAKTYVFNDFENSTNHNNGCHEVSYKLASQLSKIINKKKIEKINEE